MRGYPKRAVVSVTHSTSDLRTSRRVLIATLLAAVSYGLLTMTICLPSMPAWASYFAVDQASVQLTSPNEAMPTIASTPLSVRNAGPPESPSQVLSVSLPNTMRHSPI